VRIYKDNIRCEIDRELWHPVSLSASVGPRLRPRKFSCQTGRTDPSTRTYMTFRGIPGSIIWSPHNFSTESTQCRFFLLWHALDISRRNQVILNKRARTRDIFFGIVMITEYPLSVVFSTCPSWRAWVCYLYSASHCQTNSYHITQSLAMK
jgi:hypothetical protein